MDEVAIKVDHVSKTFKLPHEKQASVKGALINLFRGGKRTYERQQVLNDISFEIKKGEFFGIVGRNGSGKSTLLKMLAGIYTPSKGGIRVNGKLTPFIELGVGFNPELTGRENVFLNGALLGFNRKEMEAMYSDIVEFAEIERFMDQKLKNYSSGMQVRLAFSIAVRAETAILLIDEVLAVGDTSFQQKCFDYFYRLKREKRTIVFVSHDMDSVQKFCDKVALIHKGELKFVGTPQKAAALYKQLNFSEIEAAQDAELGDIAPKVVLRDQNSKTKKVFISGETMTVDISWQRNPEVQYVGVAIHRYDGLYVYGTNNISTRRFIKPKQTHCSYEVTLNLGSDNYYVEVALFGKTEGQKLYYIAQGPAFTVHNTDTWQGVTALDHQWVNS